MTDAAADWRETLTLMSEAFRLGDNVLGEELFSHALEVGAPWDIATSTAAQALSVRGAAPRRVDAPEAAPA